MPSDNNQEMFPIVDEQGNITGAAKETSIYRNDPNGKTFNRGNGIRL